MEALQIIKDYEEMFISKCEKIGLSPRETQRSLLNDPVRIAMFNNALTEISANANHSVIFKSKEYFNG